MPTSVANKNVGVCCAGAGAVFPPRIRRPPVFRNRQVSRLHVLVKRPRPSGPRRPSSGKSSASMIPVAWGLAGPETDWWAPFGSGQLAATAGRVPCSCTQLTTHSSSWGISSSSPQGALNTGMSSTYFTHNGELLHVCFPTLRISSIMITPFLIRLDEHAHILNLQYLPPSPSRD